TGGTGRLASKVTGPAAQTVPESIRTIGRPPLKAPELPTRITIRTIQPVIKTVNSEQMVRFPPMPPGAAPGSPHKASSITVHTVVNPAGAKDKTSPAATIVSPECDVDTLLGSTRPGQSRDSTAEETGQAVASPKAL